MKTKPFLYGLLFYVMFALMLGCTDQGSTVSLQAVVEESATEITPFYQGILLASETENTIFHASQTTVIYDHDDIPEHLVIAEGEGFTFFNCTLHRREGQFASQIPRLCSLSTPFGNPIVIAEYALGISDQFSPDGQWFVFAGARSGVGLSSCELDIYGYHMLQREIVLLTPTINARLCSISNFEWIVDDTATWMAFSSWTGGETNNTPLPHHRIRFDL